MTSEELEALEKLEKAATPGPWWWTDFGIKAGPRTYPELQSIVLWPSNTVDPSKLDPPLGADETGPRYWHAVMGDCGMAAEERSHFNGPLLVDLRNAAPALIAAARENDRLWAVVEAARVMHDAGVDPRNGPAGKALAELALALEALDAKGVE